MSNYRKILFAFLFFALHSIVLSQQNNYKTEILGAESGISHNYVYSFLEDSRGFFWFGTRNGLNRFDGKEFVVFNHNPFDSNSLSDSYIGPITEDEDGNIWCFTTDCVLNKLNPISGKVTKYTFYKNDYIKTNYFRTICFKDNIGKIWVKTKQELYLFDKLKDTFIPYKSEYFKREVIEKNLIIGEFDINSSGYMFFVVSNKEIKSTKIKAKILCLEPNGKLFEISIDNDFNRCFFAGSDEFGNQFVFYQSNNFEYSLKKVNIFTQKFEETNYKIDKKWVMSNGYFYFRIIGKEFWLKFYGQQDNDNPKEQLMSGFYNFDTNKVIKYDRKFQVLNCIPRPVSSLQNLNFYQSHSGTIFDVSTDAVICFIKMKYRFENITIPAPTQNVNPTFKNKLRTLFVDKSQRLWIGTNHGLLLKNNNKWDAFHYINRKHLFSNCINTIFEDDDGTVIIGTNKNTKKVNFKGGYFEDIFEKTPMEVNDFPNGIWTIIKDKDRNYWICSNSGLKKYDKNKNYIRKYSFDTNSVGDYRYEIDYFHCGYLDSYNNLWFGSDGGLAIYKKDDDNLKFYKYSESDNTTICGNKVWSIIEDKNKNLWIGIYGAGLSKYDRKSDKFKSFTLKEGLPDNGVSDIVCDNDNNLWIGTDKGLVKFVQSNEKFYLFTTSDGLLNDQFSFHSATKVGNDYLAFGSNAGLSIFNPNELKTSSDFPKVVISKFYEEDKLKYYYIKEGSTIDIDDKISYFTIQASALDISSAKIIKYAYILLGVNSSWVNIGLQNQFTLSDIEPGVYKLKIKSTNNKGEWSEEGTYIYLNIIPPYWKTKWFQSSIYGSVFIILVLNFIYFYNRKRKTEEIKRRTLFLQLKALQSQMNPHFIFNALNSILSLILNNKKELAMNYLTKFSRLLRNILDSSKDFKISLTKEIEQLRMYLDLELLRYDQSFTYAIELNTTIDTDMLQIPSMIIQPYIENAIIHGQVNKISNGMINIQFTQDKEILHVKISDNGIGRRKSAENKLEIEKDHKSLGMTMTADRLELLNSSVNITDLYDENGNSNGTIIDLSIYIKK